jgi:aminopeptidase 2
MTLVSLSTKSLLKNPTNFFVKPHRQLFQIFHRKMVTSTHHSQREVLPTNVVPTHYKLHLTPDFTTFKFAGNLAVTLDVKKPTRSIVLNALELELNHVEVDANGKVVKSKTVTMDEEGQIATFDFEEELAVADAKTTLKIVFTGVLNDKMAGFYRSSYIDKKTGEKKWLATTQMGIPFLLRGS